MLDLPHVLKAVSMIVVVLQRMWEDRVVVVCIPGSKVEVVGRRVQDGVAALLLLAGHEASSGKAEYDWLRPDLGRRFRYSERCLPRVDRYCHANVPASDQTSSRADLTTLE